MKKYKVLIVVLLLLSVSSGCGSKITQTNDVEKVKKYDSREIEKGIKIINTNLIIKSRESEISFDIRNSSGKSKYIKYVDIILLDKKGIEKKRLFGYVDKEISNNESEHVITKINVDLSDVEKIEFELK